MVEKLRCWLIDILILLSLTIPTYQLELRENVRRKIKSEKQEVEVV